MLYSQWFIPKSLHKNLINYIKVLAGMNPTITKRIQSGHISYEKVRLIGVDIRTSIIPTTYGERLEMRLFDKSRTLLEPSELGMEEDALKIFTEENQYKPEVADLTWARRNYLLDGPNDEFMNDVKDQAKLYVRLGVTQAEPNWDTGIDMKLAKQALGS